MPAAIRVIKVGGRPQGDPALRAALAAAWSAIPRALVLVHGGGDEVSTLQRALGAAPTFVDGRRVTTAADIETLRMGLSGSANKRLVADLVSLGVPALGLSGEDGALLTAVPLDAQRFGCVGTPRRVNVSLLWHLLDGGYLPVLSPVSRGAAGESQALNVNGDDAAAAIAVALAADELLLVSDVAGVRVHDAPAAQLSVLDVRRCLADGTATGGMVAKLEAALDALEGGVARVRIGDLAAITDPDRGTTICNNTLAGSLR